MKKENRRIGTSFKKHIQNFFKFNFKKNDLIFFSEINSNQFEIIINNKIILPIQGSEVTHRQMIETWITFGLVSSNEIEKNIETDEDENKSNLIKLKYLVLTDEENFLNNFINKLEYLNKLKLEERKEILLNFEYKLLKEYCNSEVNWTFKGITKEENFLNKRSFETTKEKTLKDLLSLEELQKLRKYIFDFLEISDPEDCYMEIHTKNEESISNIYDSNLDIEKYFSSKIQKINNIFDNRKIVIPILQRNYDWNQNLWNTFIKDVINITSDDKFHLFGSIILSKNIENSYYLLDGQQRITTSLLFAKSLQILYFKLTKSSIKEINVFIKKSIDNFHYKHRVQSESELKYVLNGKKPIEQSNIFVAYEYIFRSILKELDFLKTKEEKALYIKQLSNALLTKSFINITENKHENSFLIFERLNNTNLQLTKIDLLRNKLFSMLEQYNYIENEEKINHSFNKKIVEILFRKNHYDYNIFDKFIDFIFSINKIKFSKEDSFLKGMTNFDKFFICLKNIFNIKTEKLDFFEYEEVLETISKQLKIFLNITRYEKIINISKENNFLHFSDILLVFEKRLVYTPIIYFVLTNEIKLNIYKNEINSKRQILFILEKYEILFQILKYRGQSLTEKIIKITRNLLDLKTIDVNSFSNLLRKELLENEEEIKLKNNFEKNLIENPLPLKILHYLLSRVDFYFYNNRSIEIKDLKEWGFSFFSTPSLEHIIPQDFQEGKAIEWNDYFEKNEKTNLKTLQNEFRTKYKNQLGNCLLLNKGINSRLKDKIWIKKKKEYDDANITKDSFHYKGNSNDLMQLGTKEKFDFEDLKKRNQQLSKIIVDIYFGK